MNEAGQMQWMWHALQVVTLLGQVVIAWAILTGRPNKTTIAGDVSMREADSFVPASHFKSEVHRLDKRVDECQAQHRAEDEKLDQDFRSLQLEGSRRSASVHKRLDEMDRKLSAVDERSSTTQATVSMMNQNLITFLKEVRK